MTSARDRDHYHPVNVPVGVELRWNDLCQVYRPLVADGLIKQPRAAPCAVCTRGLSKKRKKERKRTDYDFLAFQIFPAPHSAADAPSHSYSIPACGRLGTVSVQAWPILLLPSHTLRAHWLSQGTDEPRTSFLTLLSFKSGWMSVILNMLIRFFCTHTRPLCSLAPLNTLTVSSSCYDWITPSTITL